MVLDANAGHPVIFLSYSREDHEWRCKFTEMLKPVVRRRRLEVWSDERIVVGEKWRPQLEQAINRSRVALLLVSSPFLASDFIMDRELPALMNQGARLVPVLIRECLWEQEPMLEQLQWAHDPNRDGPVAESDSPDGAITRVCQKLLELLPPMDDVVESGMARSAMTTITVRWRPQPITPADQPGELSGVPPLPSTFVGRKELALVRDAILGIPESAAGHNGGAVMLDGDGGVGKTVLAAALANDPTLRSYFPDGVFWVAVGEGDQFLAAQIDLLRRLGVAEPDVRSSLEGLGLLKTALAERQSLVIVDDIWSAAAAHAFRATGPRGRVLYVGRDPLVGGIDAEVIHLDVLPWDVARELLKSLGNSNGLPAEADRILKATGRVALAVALVGAALGTGRQTWAEVAERLESSGETFLDHPYANTFKAMQISLAELDEIGSDAFRSLAVFPPDTVLPVSTLGRLWSRLFGFSAERSRALLTRFVAQKLCALESDGVTLHDLQRSFALLEAGDLSLFHAEMLAAHDIDVSRGSRAWSELSAEDDYIWEHLLYHLSGTGNGRAVVALGSDLGYLARRSFLSGPFAAESDLRQVSDLFPERGEIAWLLRLFGQWSQLFTAHATIGDLAATIASRTSDAPQPIDRTSLEPLLPGRYLEPRWGLPNSPPALIRVLDSDVGWINAIDYSPDGRWLAAGGADGTVRLWDPASGGLARSLEVPDADIRAVVFSTDARHLATAGNDGQVRLWDASTGRLALMLEEAPGSLNTLAFSADGSELAGAGSDGIVRRWDPVSGRITSVLEDGAEEVLALAFSAAGYLASGSNDGVVRLWNPIDDQPPRALADHTDWVTALAFSPTGEELVSADYAGVIKVWDVTNGRVVAHLEGHVDAVSAVAFSPTGGQIATAGNDRTIRIWDVATGRPERTLRGHTRWVKALAFAPVGRQLATGGDDGTVRVWDLTSEPPSAGSDEPMERLRALAVSRDGRRIAAGGSDGIARFWDPITGRTTGALPTEDPLRAVAISPDGNHFATAGTGGVVRLFELPTGQLADEFRGHTEQVNSLSFSPDGRKLASAGNDGVVRLVELATSSLIDVLKGEGRWVNVITFSPDGRLLASGGGDHTLRLWEPASERSAVVLRGHTAEIAAIVFSHDGHQLASGGADGTLRFWDPVARRAIDSVPAHGRWVTGVAFSPDDHVIATAGNDRALRLWDAGDHSLISTLKIGSSVSRLIWGEYGITGVVATGLLQLVVAGEATAA